MPENVASRPSKTLLSPLSPSEASSQSAVHLTGWEGERLALAGDSLNRRLNGKVMCIGLRALFLLPLDVFEAVMKSS